MRPVRLVEAIFGVRSNQRWRLVSSSSYRDENMERNGLSGDNVKEERDLMEEHVEREMILTP
jgi:hypothetical protein